MLKIQKLSKSFGNKTILDEVSFTLANGQKAGLIGSNGVGKTTLMRIIAGLETKDNGTVSLESHNLIGYLRQEFFIEEEEELVKNFIKKYVGIAELEEKIERLGREIVDDESLIQEFCDAQERYALLDGYDFENKLSNIIHGLGFSEEILKKKIKELSGGQKRKIMLASVLLKGANLILLDEPTNDLDLNATRWLEEYVFKLDVPCLIISHDRRFLDKIVTKILEIDFFTKQIKEYPGNYSEYVSFKKKEQERMIDEYEMQQEQVKRLECSMRQKKEWANAGRKQGVKDNDKYTRGYERDRSSSLASNAKKIERQIEAIDFVERPKVKNKLQIRIEAKEFQGSNRIVTKELVCGYNSGFVMQPISINCNFGERIVIVGDNGSGKSTFLRTLIGIQEPISGIIEIGRAIKIGYLPQDTKESVDVTIEDYVKKMVDYDEMESKSLMYTILSQFNFEYEELKKSMLMISPGERTRVYLAIFSMIKINTLVLDEATNHLDIEALESLEEVLNTFKGTVIAITHDRTFFKNIKPDKILKVIDGKIETANYEEFVD